MRYALLEPIRGLAALWVFCFHYHFSATFHTTFPSLHAILKVGDLGVPMFFVVSGYCIAAAARSAIRNDQHWSRFLFRRLKRIYPPYWFSIAVVVSIPFVMEILTSLKTGQFTAPSAENLNYGFLDYSFADWLLVASLAKVFQIIPDAHSLQHKFTTINAVYWTLAIEVQFYLVVSAILVAFPKYFYQCILGVTALSVAVSFVPGIDTSGLFFPYWIMFAFGVLLCWILERKNSAARMLGRHHLAIAGMVCVAMLVAFLRIAAAGELISYQLFAGLFCVFLFMLYELDLVYAAKIEPSRNTLIRVPVLAITAIGAMSYSLYLLHGRLQHLVAQLTRQVVAVDTITCDLIVIIVTCAICYLFYWYCERPFINSNRKPNTQVAQ